MTNTLYMRPCVGVEMDCACTCIGSDKMCILCFTVFFFLFTYFGLSLFYVDYWPFVFLLDCIDLNGRNLTVNFPHE